MPEKPQAEPICALATASGRAALAIVRLSGLGVADIAHKVTHRKLEKRQATYTKFFDQDNEVIDEGVAIYFQQPASYTGEDVVEFQCHGNPMIAELLLDTLCKHGARLATPGEFSQRAFLNNKIDLAQAEAIADLISSTTECGVRTATRSLQGEFSKRVQKILAALIEIRTNIEAYLDFPDEEIDTQQGRELEAKLVHLHAELTQLLQQAQHGEKLQTGATIAIAGRPNAGKSSLMNALAQSEIAIVTEIPGTTRDPLMVDIDIKGLPVRLIDTAGLRETKDTIEVLGIERAQQALSQADLILWVTDVSQPEQQLPQDIDEHKTVHVHNKIDLIARQVSANLNELYISVKTGQGLTNLIDVIAKRFNQSELGDTPFLARRRHLIALQRAQKHAQQALNQFKQASNLELVAEDLRITQDCLGEVTGEFTSDELLGKIFSEFCIGK